MSFRSLRCGKRYRCDALEPRRLLTHTFSGNPANGSENLLITIDATQVRFRINGGPEQSTADPDVIVDGLAGTNNFQIFDNTGGARAAPLTLRLASGSFGNDVIVGSAAVPTNFERLNTTLTVDLPAGATVEMVDADDTPVSSTFVLSTLASPERQRVAKGNFVGLFPQHESWSVSIDLHGSGASDVFAVAGMASHTYFNIFGEGGDDSVITVNNGANNHDDDLDAIFNPTFPFKFDGGPGTDFLDLDDSSDQIGDGDADYVFRATGSVGSLRKGSTLIVNFTPSTIERYYLGGDDDANVFTIDQSGSRPSVTVVGGGGDDRFTNDAFEKALDGFGGGGAFIGGPGVDSIELNDAAGTLPKDYTFELSSFEVRLQSILTQPYTLDSVESFILDENAAAAGHALNGKPAGMAMNIVAEDGADTFTVGNGNLGANNWLAGNVTLTGGAGADAVTFDDRLASGSPAFPGNYAFDTFAFGKGGPTLQYNSIDAQTLYTSDVINGPVYVDATVNLNSLSGFIGSTTVRGGNVRGVLLNVGNGTLSNLSGSIAAIWGAASGSVVVNDQLNATARSYQVQPFGLASPISVNLSTGGSLGILAGTGADQVSVSGLAAGRTLFVNGGDGNDTLTAGNGTLDAIDGPVDFAGGNGTADQLVINAGAAPASTVATIAAGSATVAGVPASIDWFGGTDQVELIAGPNGSVVEVIATATGVPVTVTGSAGSDQLAVGDGNYSANILGAVTFNAGNGDDFITYDDAASVAHDNYTFSGGNGFSKASPAAATTTSSAEHKTLEGGSGNNLVNVLNATLDLLVRTHAGNDTVNVVVAGAPVRIDTGPGAGDAISVDDGNNSGGSVAIVDANDGVQNLLVARGDKLVVPQAVTLERTSGVLSGVFGTVDLAGGALLLRSAAAAESTLRGYATRGYNAGAWNGTSPSGVLHSSTAAASPASDGVGSALGSNVGIPSIGGFTINADDLLARHTLYGDVDLTRTVNFNDLLKLAQNYGVATGGTWATGDANYDGAVNFPDLLTLAQNYGLSLTTLPSIAANSSAGTTVGARAGAARQSDREDEENDDRSLLL